MTLNLARANLSSEPLNVAINAMIEHGSLIRHAQNQPRHYLGASLIGDECSRKVQFEWLCGSSFPARVHSIFQRGHFFKTESRQLLVEAGFLFEPEVARLGFVTADGLMAGHADGLVLGVPVGVDLITPSIWEHKGLNAKNYRAVERDGLSKVLPRYAAQIALYQAFLDVLNPALVTITNADTCERLHFAVPYDDRLADASHERAMTVIGATRAGELLPRFDPSLTDFRCKMCSHLERCRRHE